MNTKMFKATFAALLAGAILVGPAGTLSAFAATKKKSTETEQTDTKTDTKKKKELTPGQKAARERMKKCGAEWKEMKAAGKVPTGMTWPKFWSACNKRLKAAK